MALDRREDMPVYVMANLDVIQNVRLSVFGGAIMSGKIRLEDKNGDALTLTRLRPCTNCRCKTWNLFLNKRYRAYASLVKNR